MAHPLFKAPTSRTLTLELFNPYSTQRKIWFSPARFNVAAWGRQSGKTTFGLNKMLDRAWRGRPGGIYWFVMQTFTAAEGAWRRMAEMVQAKGVCSRRPRVSDLTIHLRNGATVFFKSGDNFENLRSETLDGAMIDEVRLQDAKLWPIIIRPMLAHHKGWCDFLSTPNGFDHFYDLFEFARLGNDDEWAAFHAPSSDAPWWDEREIASAKRSMSEAEFAQEILAEFRDMVGGKAYVSHGDWNYVGANPFDSQNRIWSPYLPIVVGMDFNVNPISWALCQTRADQFYFGDEIWIENTHTLEASKVLVEKVKDHKPGIIIVGDSSGKARKTSAAGETDYTIIEKVMREHGIPFENRTPDSNPPVKDRVNTMCGRLRDAEGKPHLFYNPNKMPYLKKDFDRVKWKKGAGAVLDEGKEKMFTHMSDAAGYPVHLLTTKWGAGVGKVALVVK